MPAAQRKNFLIFRLPAVQAEMPQQAAQDLPQALPGHCRLRHKLDPGQLLLAGFDDEHYELAIRQIREYTAERLAEV